MITPASNENIFLSIATDIKNLEQSRANDDKQEHSQQNGTHLDFILFFFLHHNDIIPLTSFSPSSMPDVSRFSFSSPGRLPLLDT